MSNTVRLVDVKKDPRFTTASWEGASLDAAIVANIRAQGREGKPLDVMTKVQHAVLTETTREDSVFAVAPTGSGKTIAFLAPILQGMLDGEVAGAVLLSPTNPLRKQHVAVSNALVKGLAKPVAVIAIEDASSATQLRLTGAPRAIVASTSEKWLALVREPAMAAYMKDTVDVLVLDEVDEMVRNPGFYKHIKEICKVCTNARIFAFTATPSDEALAFVKSLPLRSLAHIDADDVDSKNHTHEYTSVPSADLMPALLALVEREASQKAMIFFNTSMFAEFAYHYLVASGCKNIHMLHTRMSNGAARRSEATFHECSECFLLSSNVTARGMDFPDVGVVIQVGPSPPELYVQRVGRSGRAGKTGRGVLLLVDEERDAMLGALKGRVETVHTELEVLPNKVTAPLKNADQGFKSLIGAYNSEARALKWKMSDIVAVIKSIFQGAGQKIPSITQQYARKAKVTEADGLVIVGGGPRPQPANIHAIVGLATATILCTLLSTILP